MRDFQHCTVVCGQKRIHPPNSPLLRKIDKSGDSVIDYAKICGYLGDEGILDQNLPDPIKQKVVREFQKCLTGSKLPQADLYPDGDDKYVKWMKMLCAKNPRRAEFVELGEIRAGVFLYALRVTSNIRKNFQNPNFIFTGLLHGKEWATGLAVVQTAKMMLESIGDRPMGRRLRNAETWFVPIANPMGYKVSRNIFPQWRKNWRLNQMRPQAHLSTNQLPMGVDLNRNSGSGSEFAFNGGAPLSRQVKRLLEDPTSPLYRGPYPASEKEVALLQGLISKTRPVGLLDVHSHGNYFVSPSLPENDPAREDLYANIVERLSFVSGFEREKRTSPAPGMLIDYADNGKNGTVGLIAEIGAHDQPDRAELKKLLRIVPKMNVTFIDLILASLKTDSGI